MAAKKKSTRVRWLVLAGLAGAGVWVVRSRRTGSAGLLEEWPATPSSPTGSPANLTPATPGAATPPLGVELPAAAPSAEPGGDAPPADRETVVTPVDAGPDVRAPAVVAGAEAVALPVDEPPVAPPLDADADVRAAPSAAEPTPSAPTSLSGQALFSPPGGRAGPDPDLGAAEPAGSRPSPTPRRPRPAAAEPGFGHSPGSAPARPDGSAPGPEYTIKGNAGSMLFHRPDSPYYGRTKAQVWFRTATDARAAGFTEWVPKRQAEPSPTSEASDPRR